jgi:hypothetical protein
VVCTNLLEHVRRPWAVVEQCATVLKIGGVAVFTAPWVYKEHPDPIDCWRVNIEGMRGLIGTNFKELACEQARDAGKGIVVTMFAGVRV